MVLTGDFTRFSTAYTALILFAMFCYMTNKRDLTTFIKIISYGAIFVSSLIIFIIGFGIYGFTNTDYTVESASEAADNGEFNDFNTQIRYIFYVNSNF